jgi:hypothetical protein
MTISPPETQAIVAEPALLGYAALVWVMVAAFVEEPHLLRQFGEAYRAYLAAVPGWIPRLRPWESGRGEGRSGGGGGSVARG